MGRICSVQPLCFLNISLLETPLLSQHHIILSLLFHILISKDLNYNHQSSLHPQKFKTLSFISPCMRTCLSAVFFSFSFFFFSRNHHSINIPPRYKALMSACLLRLTLISPKVSAHRVRDTEGRKEGGKKSCLHIQQKDVAELLSSLGCPLVSL